MGRTRRGLTGLFAALVGLATLAALGILVPRPLFSSAAAVSDAGLGSRRILILSSDIHSDIALPADRDIVERFGFMAADGLDPALPGAEWIVAGWGSRAFYIATPTWADVRPGPMLKAFTLDSSVMHMSLAGPIDPASPSVRAIDLPAEDFARLLVAIEADFARDASGAARLIPGASYGDYDLFYEAEGWFNALVGCNLWTAAVLRDAGLTTGWWTPLPQFLDASLELHNTLPSPGQLSGDL